MKKLLLGLALAGITSVNSHAVSVYVDKDQVDAVLAPGASIGGNFNIDTGDGSGAPDVFGFSGLPEYIVSATAKFDIYFQAGDIQSLISATFDLGTPIVQSGGGSDYLTFVMGTGVGGANAAVLFDLQADGSLNWLVTNNSLTQTIEVDTAGLFAVAAGPDGGSTVMLLGSTLMGMAALARRKK